MKKFLTIVFTVALAALPTMAMASLDLIQEGCQVEGNTVTTTFAVANYNSPVPVADVHLIPENPVPGCTIIGCGVPAGWLCTLNPATLGVDYQVLDPASAVFAGQIEHGFTFVLDPDFCCYIVQFTGPNHEVLLEVEKCFSCVHVGAAPETWGNVKQLFR
jgi:hypothetical protein